MAEALFSGDRRSVIRRIEEWSRPGRGRNTMRFAHLQVPPGVMEQSSTEDSVPCAIWTEVTNARISVDVSHVTGECKAKDIVESRMRAWYQTHPGVVQPDGMSLDTKSYREMVDTMRKASFPRGGGTMPASILPPMSGSLWIIDIDPDMPADLMRVLALVLPWAEANSRVRPVTSMRVLAMSSDPLHPLVQGLFQDWETCPTSQFQILEAGVGQVETVDVASTTDMMPVVMRKAASLGPEASQTVVSFNFLQGGCPQDWSRDSILFNNAQRSILLHGYGARVPERSIGSDYVHVITHGSRYRQIFDYRTNTIVKVQVKVSASEQRDQLSWANRADTRHSNVILYKEHGDFNTARPRRLDVAGHQLSGFLASLAEFAHWPIRADRLMAALGRVDPVALHETKRRLVQQGLLAFNGPSPAPVLALPHATHKVFFAVLEDVEYDARLARFLSESPRNPRSTLVKVQLATLLTLGMHKMVQISTDHITVEDVLQFASVGLVGSYSGLGTMWLFLNIVKAAIVGMGHRPRLPRQIVQVPGSSVSVRGLCDFEELSARLRGSLLSLGIETAVMNPDTETGSLTTLEINDILWDFLRAFAHQICIMRGLERRLLTFLDVESQQELSCNNLGIWAIRWGLIERFDGRTRFWAGVYTSLGRDPGRPLASMLDFNWIPLSLLERWKQEMKPLSEPRGPPSFGSNVDEV
ncbi:hypothetical protein EDB80DRAFT_814479 [Ilyonectria destructans]|nr:hypothetical protein EDB80DRAFT_814479 [Ilyonectria destructans]